MTVPMGRMETEEALVLRSVLWGELGLSWSSVPRCMPGYEEWGTRDRVGCRL